MPQRNAADVAFFLIGGRNVHTVLTDFEDRQEARTEESHGLGTSWAEHQFTGVREGEITANGFYDDAANSIHEALSTGPAGTTAILCYGLEGTATGARFTGWAGGLQVNYERQAERDGLTKARVNYRTAGTVETGKLLRTYKPGVATGIATGLAVDHGACSTGGAGYLQWNATAGEANIRIMQSPDQTAWADLFVFTKTAPAAAGAQRMSTGGVIQRYTAVDLTTASATGTVAALNFMVGLVRTATA